MHETTRDLTPPERLALWQHTKGYTKARAAEVIGISAGFYSRILAGAIPKLTETLRLIEMKTGIPPGDWLPAKGGQP